MMTPVRLTKTQTQVIALAKRCGDIYRDGNRVYAYNPENRARISILVHGNTILSLVRKGQLVRDVSVSTMQASYRLPS